MPALVELPADGNPLSPSFLTHALTAAASSNQQQIRAGTSQLQAWETKQGYFTLLQDVFIQASLPTEVRLLSLIQLKNGIDKYWRKSATNAIPQDERSTIRSRLLSSGLNEPRDNLANLNAVVTAKITRYDFPGQWPHLFDDLIELLKSSAQPSSPPKHLSRVLIITHHVIKELATIRLQRSRANLLTAAPKLFIVLQDLYLFKLAQWQHELGDAAADFSLQASSTLNDNHRILKIVRRLVISGFEFPHRNSIVKDFWNVSQAHMQLYLEMFHQHHLHEAYKISAGQHLKQFAKVHVDMATDHPVSFALLPNTVPLVRSYWSSAELMRKRQTSSPDELSEEQTIVYDGYNLRALLLLRACFKLVYSPSQLFKYKNAEGKDEPAQSKELIKSKLFIVDFITGLCNTLTDYFFVYIQSDIEELTSEPEEWEIKEASGGDAFERSVRPCAERLFLDIAMHYKDMIIEPLLAKLASMCNPQNDNILIKDAAYSAIGVAAPILHTKLDFNSFFTGTLIPELQSQQPMHSILRRRISILLAQWISLDISEANRSLVYEVFQHLLDRTVPLNDEIVRITAGKRFGDVVVAWEFNAPQFLQYCSKILHQIIDLIEEVHLLETKLALLQTVGATIDAMERHITTFADEIVSLLPRLWNENNQENLMKQAIVSILSKLVKAMKADSGPIHSMMLPTIKLAMEPGSEAQLYLLDDCLDLWATIVRQTQTPTPTHALHSELLSMVPLLYPMFEMEQDYIRKAMNITESYILLAPSHCLDERVLVDLLQSFTSLLTVRKTDIIDAVANNAELLIREAEAMGDQAFESITYSLARSGFLGHIIRSLYSNWETHQTTGPKRKDPPPDWKNETSYFAVLARIVLASPRLFQSVMKIWADSEGKDLPSEMPKLIDEWFSHVDAAGSPAKSKLMCLALTKLLETGEPWILSKLQDLLALWTSTVVELRDGDHESRSDSLVFAQPPPPASYEEIPEEERRRAVTYSDPVHVINLGQFIKYHLGNTVVQCGGEGRFQEQWLVNVDKDVVKSFGQLGIM